MNIEINVGNNLSELIKDLPPDEKRIVLMNLLGKIEIVSGLEKEEEKIKR